MKTTLLPLALFLLAALPSRALTVVRSPQEAAVSSFTTINWKQLRYVPARGELVASLTFTNQNYVSDDEARYDQRNDFVLPGVRFEKSSGTFFLHTRAGDKPVAVLKSALRGVVLLPTAKIQIVHNGGKVHLELVSLDRPADGTRWIEVARHAF